ncbi:Hpt domain protein [Pseudopedobacter saltans DSM 12145]|uniref:Hpt domain protein n=1 Tax=Pseudopedobacter saltans (strain ATCC 51119 / DSM 12145 / JCM 21818 / CCUG 39354 / LMG 10337 / NBRC 100064 / NCIMB 13643) TaxID=762903 RepID=F0SB19_PSESL|nr:Hpt domain-containing protein [Pseudopedobacter saltans]ADY52654.1 Hpt domain protein [Pseudopedobacter saltans DSM 12145]
MNLNDIRIDLSYLDEVAGGNAEFLVEMIDIFLQQTPKYVNDLKLAIDEKNWKGIAETAHKIKPTLTFIGLLKEQEEMANIERQARSEENYEGIKISFDSLCQVFDIAYKSLEIKKNELIANF